MSAYVLVKRVKRLRIHSQLATLRYERRLGQAEDSREVRRAVFLQISRKGIGSSRLVLDSAGRDAARVDRCKGVWAQMVRGRRCPGAVGRMVLVVEGAFGRSTTIVPSAKTQTSRSESSACSEDWEAVGVGGLEVRRRRRDLPGFEAEEGECLGAKDPSGFVWDSNRPAAELL